MGATAPRSPATAFTVTVLLFPVVAVAFYLALTNEVSTGRREYVASIVVSAAALTASSLIYGFAVVRAVLGLGYRLVVPAAAALAAYAYLKYYGFASPAWESVAYTFLVYSLWFLVALLASTTASSLTEPPLSKPGGSPLRLLKALIETTVRNAGRATLAIALVAALPATAYILSLLYTSVQGEPLLSGDQVVLPGLQSPVKAEDAVKTIRVDPESGEAVIEIQSPKGDVFTLYGTIEAASEDRTVIRTSRGILAVSDNITGKIVMVSDENLESVQSDTDIKNSLLHKMASAVLPPLLELIPSQEGTHISYIASGIILYLAGSLLARLSGYR
ncbi:hypothetical protein APE_1409.1 [Aeropyrum pernix K1]|uniref:Uncharacterized protein n=1 Tax=Aeropyrum pernix (strain ATCC 700893 / DSM 11879 / JCM 9820 / NBRC 100138 / K1) TaxID=272557 RepID=Q9YC42_AERPE|nr:hypothetical protein [Aeropyrum pernix]BAA80406.2 hypothetical protein APE_1409.1 [Aeropyrum pernix K1]